jgi:hypothetical protein
MDDENPHGGSRTPLGQVPQPGEDEFESEARVLARKPKQGESERRETSPPAHDEREQLHPRGQRSHGARAARRHRPRDQHAPRGGSDDTQIESRQAMAQAHELHDEEHGPGLTDMAVGNPGNPKIRVSANMGAVLRAMTAIPMMTSRRISWRAWYARMRTWLPAIPTTPGP